MTSLILLQFTKSNEITDLVTEYAEPLEEGSDLTYFLNITYDGVDKNGVEAGSGVTAKVYSDYIYVEDKLDDNLTFKEFSDGTNPVSGVIGAYSDVELEDGKSCTGFVFDDSEGSEDANNRFGLHYNPDTHKISFKVKNLQAGCKLTVGIVTTLPTGIPKGKRVDIYNQATAVDGAQTINSNKTHVWLGEEVETYRVKYVYDSSYPVPDNAPEVPYKGATASEDGAYFPAGNTVTIAAKPILKGYDFIGWISDGITSNDTSFTMPSHEVTLKGYFREKDKYTVSYIIDGEGPNEEDYKVPESEDIYVDEDVFLDQTLKVGDQVGEYILKEIKVEGVTPDEEGYFKMPNEDVLVTLRFEKKKYKVIYKFHEGVRPPNYEEILTRINGGENDNMYAKDEIVTLPVVDTFSPVLGIGGYDYYFQGWYKEDNFKMPVVPDTEEGYIIYGEWLRVAGTFEPVITKTISNPKSYYRIGDRVLYDITVTNNESYSIKKVKVSENNLNAHFIDDKSGNYNVITEHVVEILEIPANSSITVKAEYVVESKDMAKDITNEVQIVGSGKSDNGYQLDPSKEYKATTTFKTQVRVNLCKAIDQTTYNNLFQFKISNDKEKLKSDINIINDGGKICQAVYLSPSTSPYKITETIPQEYELESIDNIKNVSYKELLVEENEEYTVLFTNNYRKKGFFRTFGNIINHIEGGSRWKNLMKKAKN